MKKELIIHNYELHSDDWYNFRFNGIGGSEMGTVLGINKYDTAVRLFHEKIGTIAQKRDDNERMFWGRAAEDLVANVWQYYDNTKDGYIENFKNNRIIRKCRSVNGYVVNPAYPWLFASLDRLINREGGINFITGETLKSEGILECKNMGYWMSKMWEDGIPIYHLAQIHTYMIILETDYAEIAMLVDGGNLVVEKVMRDDLLCEKIINISKSFWYDRVVPAREAKAKMDIYDASGNVRESEKQNAIIQRYEPDPDESEAYAEFMNQKFVKTRESIAGNMTLYYMAKKDKLLLALKNRIDTERTKIKNVFVQFLSQNNAESVDFDKLGSVSWSEKKGSQNRVFNNRFKESVSEDHIEDLFQKIETDN